MMLKLLMLLLVVAGLIYWVKQPRRVLPGSTNSAEPVRRPAFVRLSITAILSAAASFLSFFFWLAAVAGGTTGGGYRGQMDYLLTVAQILLTLAVVCAVAAFFKRRG